VPHSKELKGAQGVLMQASDYASIIHYLALFLVLGSGVEIYVRHKGLLAREDKMREGTVVSGKRPLAPPILMLVVAAATAIATWPA
jgi:hypothetical protein